MNPNSCQRLTALFKGYSLPYHNEQVNFSISWSYYSGLLIQVQVCKNSGCWQSVWHIIMLQKQKPSSTIICWYVPLFSVLSACPCYCCESRNSVTAIFWWTWRPICFLLMRRIKKKISCFTVTQRHSPVDKHEMRFCWVVLSADGREV